MSTLEELVARATETCTKLKDERFQLCTTELRIHMTNEITKQLEALIPKPTIKIVMDTHHHLKRVAEHFHVGHHQKALPILQGYLDHVLNAMKIDADVKQVCAKKKSFSNYSDDYDENVIEITVEFNNPMFKK